jgi:O-methyltransferase
MSEIYEFELLRYIFLNKIEGALVECGVHEGAQEYEWIKILMENNIEPRDIYLYDTFAGLVEPSKYDYTCKDAILDTKTSEETYEYWKNQIITNNINNWCYAPIEKVKLNLYSTGYPRNKLHFIVGNTIETLQIKENIPEKIAILRLDTDWYESSKVELEKLYNNVVVGGVIIFDDYYHWDGQRRAVDEFFKFINIDYEIIKINNNKTGAVIKK